MPTLFGQMALRFGAHPENLATEGLGYILRSSAAARAALTDLVRALGTAIPSPLSFRNQDSADEGGIPDIVGVDAAGVLRVVLEAKFWAGLTDNQPVAYFDRLPQNDGILLFVAPIQRSSVLWHEFRRRCTAAGLVLAARPFNASWTVAATPSGRLLALTSWSVLLSTLTAEAIRQGDGVASADLAQLRGLSDEVERDAFLPVRPEELTTTVHRRVLDFVSLVAPIVDMLVAEGVAVREGRLTHEAGSTSFKLGLPNVGGVQAWLSCDVWAWMKRAPTPFWLKVDGPHRAAIQTALAPLDAVSQQVFDDDGAPYVALFVPSGAEEAQVIRAVVDGVRSVAALVPAAPAAAQAVPPAAPAAPLVPAV